MSVVLLIEPDAVLAKIYSNYLSKKNIKVLHAKNAQKAILLADKLKPDLVILEIQLIEHSGIEFLYEFRSYYEWQNIPVIINSHVSPAEFNQSAQVLKNDLGVNHYLYKSTSNLSDLLNSINEFIVIKL